MRILALDPGSKRVGVAVSDDIGILALPLEFIPAETASGLLERLKAIALEKQAGRNPRRSAAQYERHLRPGGGSGPGFRRRRERGARPPCQNVDERLTSAQALALIEAGVRRDQRKTKSRPKVPPPCSCKATWTPAAGGRAVSM